VQRVRPGEEYGGWTVTVLDSRSVELESNGNFQTLTMFTDMGEQPARGMGGQDWNGDGIPDEPFDPKAGGEDWDGDGIPDDQVNPPMEGEDWDGDGIPDENAEPPQAGEPTFEGDGEASFEEPAIEQSDGDGEQAEEQPFE
jgi:hypothetical protein